MFLPTLSLISQKNASLIWNFNLSPVILTEQQFHSRCLPSHVKKANTNANILGAAVFKLFFWRSPGCHCFQIDKKGNCSCSLWLLFTFPRCWGSVVAFLIPVLAFSSVLCSAMVLEHAPCALPTAETPASFSYCPSPQWGLSGASRWQHHRQVVCLSDRGDLSVCLFCAVTWAPAPRCTPPAHWIISLQQAGRNNIEGSGTDIYKK